MLKGDRTACLGMSEPGAGSDLAGLSTRAEVFDDHFVVNGQKVWTSGAHDADCCICFVRTDPVAPKHRGISVLLLDMDTPGIDARPFPSLVDRDHPDFNEVFFTDVVVPRENLLGELNDGWRIANGSLAHERGMLWVWESARLEQSLEMVLHRARDTGIGADDEFRDAYAAAYVDALALKCLGYRGFAKFARGHDAPEHLLLKVFGSEANQRLFLETTEALGIDALDTGQSHHAGRFDEEWPWALRYLAVVRGDDLGRHVGDPAQHRRRTRPRPPPEVTPVPEEPVGDTGKMEPATTAGTRWRSTRPAGSGCRCSSGPSPTPRTAGRGPTNRS